MLIRGQHNASSARSARREAQEEIGFGSVQRPKANFVDEPQTAVEVALGPEPHRRDHRRRPGTRASGRRARNGNGEAILDRLDA